MNRKRSKWWPIADAIRAEQLRKLRARYEDR
jgi:hypothetical protein